MQSYLVSATLKDELPVEHSGHLQNCLAKAAYDNIAESPDELAFRKGDVLTVLEQNTNGLEGWWLCALRGRQGICPGNRLRLLAGMYDTAPSPTHNHQMSKRRSCLINPNKVVTPHKVGDVYLYDTVGTKADEYDVPPTCKMPSLDNETLTVGGGGPGDSYDVPPSHKLAYDVPRLHVKAPSPQNGSQDVKGKKMEAYDFPRPLSTCSGKESNDYDVPRDFPSSEDGGTYDIPPSHHITVADVYDVPPSHVASNRSSGVSMFSTGSSAMSPSSSACSLTPSLSLSSLGGTGSNRSSLEQQHELYDIPPSEVRLVHQIHAGETYDVPTNKFTSELYDHPPKQKTTSIPMLSDGVYDVPPQVTKDTGRTPEDTVDSRMKRLSTTSVESRDSVPPIIHGKELPLELSAAMDTLIRLQQEVVSAITKLFGFVSSTWRCKENMENKIYDIKLACLRMRNALQEFVDFAQGALVNSTRASDKMLCHKLAKLVTPLQNANSIVQKTTQSLDQQGWSVPKLTSGTPDELDQLITCAREVTEDVRQVSSFVQGNATLLFKRAAPMPSSKAKTSGGAVQERPLPPTPATKTKEENTYENDWIDDYDYVNLESKEAVEKENEEIKAALPKELRKSFENILKESHVLVKDDVNRHLGGPTNKLSSVGRLDANDRQVVRFYGAQVETHITFLTNAIDAFLATIENNQPPKVFIGHSKFVVLSAHKLIYIGDTVHRNTVNVDLRNKVMLCSNSLCDALKSTVQCTKAAAQQFPSVIAVQEMVDSVVDISHSANDLKLVILQAAEL